MIRCSPILQLGVLALSDLLAGCGGGPDNAAGGDAAGTVAVSTVVPRRQTFHDTIEAVGSAVGDPRHATTLSLAYGGQIVAVDVAAGQRVRRGQPLLAISADPATRSAYQQARSAIGLARGDLQRTEQLAAQRLATQSQLAAARKALADAQAALQAQMAIGGGGAEHVVAAPADGVATAVRVGLGERVAANAPLLDFTPDRALMVQLGVQSGDGGTLHAGMPVRLTGVYGRSTGFTGRLRMVGRALDPQTHLLPVQVELPPGVDDGLVAGMALTAQIDVGDFSAWAVPRGAVLRDDRGSYLFQVHDGHARRVDVDLRSPDGDTVGVEGALDPRAPVVVLGVYELGDGDAVQVAPAAKAVAPAAAAPGSAGAALTDSSR